MKIVSLTVVRGLPTGITRQLQYEYESSMNIDGVQWKTILYSTQTSDLPFARKIPYGFKFLFVRNVYAWYVAIKEAKNADFILMRYMPFDIAGLIFSPFLKNRISIHHAKEPVELKLVRCGWKGWLASTIEKITGYFVIRNSVAIFGVTREIAEYEVSRLRTKLPFAVYPNGIDAGFVPVASDFRIRDEVNAVFICQEFSPWQGLEKLISDAIHCDLVIKSKLKIHLVGDLTCQQKDTIRSLACKEIFVMHGVLSPEKYRKIFEIADVGIGSLALEKEGLSEGSTLKVREMLCMGLIVYSNHVDSSLPEDFPYYQIDTIPTLRGLYEFGAFHKDVGRDVVRDRALPYISKDQIMVGAVCEMKKLLLLRSS